MLRPWTKTRHLPLRQIGRDVLFVDLGLLHVGQADHDHVRAAHGLGGVDHLEAVLFGDLAGLGAGIEADDDPAPAVLQV